MLKLKGPAKGQLSCMAYALLTVDNRIKNRAGGGGSSVGPNVKKPTSWAKGGRSRPKDTPPPPPDPHLPRKSSEEGTFKKH